MDHPPPLILVIDDEPMIRRTIRDWMEDAGFAVAEAGDGQAGLTAFDRDKPDLVFVDLRMPRMDGLAVLAALRESAPETPVIVVSGAGALQDAVTALRLGAWDYVTKPVEDMAVVELAARRAMDKADLIRENRLYRDHLESLIDLRTRDLRLAKEEAEAANRSKTEFLAIMSHELRTPLHGVLGMLHLLLGTPLDETQVTYASAAQKAGRGLLTIIGDLLDLSQIEAGAVELRPGLFRVEEMVHSVLAGFEAEAQTRGLVLDLDLGPDLDRPLTGDEGRLRQVLFNLVGNALKFTDRGRVGLWARLLPGLGASRVLLVCVEDTGIGIPDSQIAQAFKPFTQLAPSSTRRHGGAGLGLGIVRRLVQLMGGTICLDSQEGRGTAVYFTVRVQTGGRETRPKAAPSPPVRPLRVLVAEDEQINRLGVSHLLVRLGHSPRCVENGLKALAALAEEDFDCVLMDIQMPELDGVEAARAIRSLNGPRSGVPIVALTAHAMEGDRESFLAAGMDDYLAKPFEAEDLARVLARAAAATGPRAPGNKK